MTMTEAPWRRPADAEREAFSAIGWRTNAPVFPPSWGQELAPSGMLGARPALAHGRRAAPRRRRDRKSPEMTTTPTQPAAPSDPSNALLSPQPASLTTVAVKLAGEVSGDRVLATIRTSSATVSVFLTAEEAEAWADQLVQARRRMSPLILAGPSSSGPTAADLARLAASVPR